MHTQMRTHMGGQAHKAERNSTFSWIQPVTESITHKETDSTTLVQFNNIQSMIQSSVSKLLSSAVSYTPTGFTSLSSKTKLTALEAYIQPFCQTAKKKKKSLKVKELNIKE